MKTGRSNLLGKTFAALMLMTVPVASQATLVYELIDGNSFIYDTVDGVTWTQNANISGQTFDWQNATNWAASLSFAGLYETWELPTSQQFRDLFLQLEPNGLGNVYGSQIFFGAGANDYVSNVQTGYWTNNSADYVNFYYGYGGYASPSSLYNAWAVAFIPEPATLSLLVFGLASCWVQSKRRTIQLNLEFQLCSGRQGKLHIQTKLLPMSAYQIRYSGLWYSKLCGCFGLS